MAWTTPRTWVYNEVVTAALFNTHIRDNQGILKTSIDDAGKIVALSSTYLANLSGANLTGVPQASDDQDATGKNDYSGGRFVVPVGTDLYVDDGGTKRAGSIWIEGDYLHHVDSTNSEWRFLGTYVSTPAGAVPGSVWVEGATLRYIDADGDERYCLRDGSILHTDAGALAGSLWAETADDYLHLIREGYTTEYAVHNDTAHADGTSHTNSHSNVAFVDSYTDVTFVDSHSDWYSDNGSYSDTYVPHVDGHGNSYSDTPHQNSYSDTSHQDFTDSHSDYADTPHEDAPEEIGA